MLFLQIVDTGGQGCSRFLRFQGLQHLLIPPGVADPYQSTDIDINININKLKVAFLIESVTMNLQTVLPQSGWLFLKTPVEKRNT